MMNSSCVPVIFDTKRICDKHVGLKHHKHLNHVELHRFAVWKFVKTDLKHIGKPERGKHTMGGFGIGDIQLSE